MTDISRSLKNEIRDRAEGVSEMSGLNTRNMEFCHLNHNKQSSCYDNVCNIIYVTDVEHWVFHRAFATDPSIIGLSIEENERAIAATGYRVYEYNQEHDVTDFCKEAATKSARRNWFDYFAAKHNYMAVFFVDEE